MKPTTGTPPGARTQRLMGWGRTIPSTSLVVPARSPRRLREVINGGPTIPRGLGRSYGDAAQNGGGMVVDTTRMPRRFVLDVVNGTLDVDTGSTIEDLLRKLVPLGWFVPVTPGTAQVTIGGAIASDVHGKNHHGDGTFGHHVVDITLQTGAGERVLRPNDDSAPQFWATVGGMGLTGVISRATIRLRRIETSMILSNTQRTRDLDDTMGRLVDIDRDSPYSVAWLDASAARTSFGRGVVTSGHHAPAEVTASATRYAPRALSVPAPGMPSPPAFAIRAFNRVWYRAARPGTRLESITSFFHPLDAVANWNRVYGRRGFLQWQFVVPDGGERVLVDALAELSRVRGAPPCLVVLKRFGASNPSPLSFPIPGWTLAVDLPARGLELRNTLHRLDGKIAAAGGRLYLAKDSRVRSEVLADMYPRLDEWRRIRDGLDPERRMTSDLARRLHLIEPDPKVQLS